MASRNPRSEAARRAGIPAGPATPDGGTDLVIVILNEHANAGVAVGCQATFYDYAATIPAVSAALVAP